MFPSHHQLGIVVRVLALMTQILSSKLIVWSSCCHLNFQAVSQLLKRSAPKNAAPVGAAENARIAVLLWPDVAHGTELRGTEVA